MKVTFEISGIKNDQGYVRGLAFSQEKGFPESPKFADAIAETKAKKGTVRLSFDVKTPQAAFVFFHDEKNIRRMEKNILGIPKSGVALTNWNRRSKPKFSAAVVEVTPSQKLKIKYF